MASRKNDTGSTSPCVAKPSRPGQTVAMKHATVAAFALVAAGSWSVPAHSSSTDWFEAQGGRIRLVTTGMPDAQGRLKGILDIHLDTGWKTYWRDPGDAGVPPSLNLTGSTNVSGAEVSFPAPQRHDDGYSLWAGYDRSLALPITFHIASPDKPAVISADVFLGICEAICIPVHANFTLDPASAPDDPADATSVARAIQALPMAARSDFGATIVGQDDKTLLVAAALPFGASSAELFLAGDDGYVFAAPKRNEKNGKTVFSVEVLDRPALNPAAGGLHYTLVTDRGAVSGILPYP